MSLNLDSYLKDGATEKLKVLEDLTMNVKQIQDDVLKEILTLNANTEYLKRFLHGSSDKELFKKNVPVVSYEDVKPYIDRIVNGGPSDIISGEPITRFLVSSGTSGGKQKMFPSNEKYLKNMKFIYDLRSLVISKHVDGVEQGKAMMFYSTTPGSTTPSSLPAASASTSFFKSEFFKDHQSYWYYSYTNPHDVFLCPDTKQSLYCHFLCGLVHREKVVRVGALFASVLVRAITFLQDSWEELCDNIRSGHLSEWVTDPNSRKSVSALLGGPNPELADLIASKCSQESWQGIIPRLWPKTKFIETIVTGQFSQYVPALEFYTNDLPLVTTTYGSSETFFGINVDPLCKPKDISFTCMPNLSYFEFESFGGGSNNEVVDLVDVKLGCYYEPLITNYSGLHRCRLGDVVQVTGFYNNAPQFKFIRRKKVLLSVYVEATTEEDLVKAVTHGKLILESLDLILMNFTSYADISTDPGHYVLYFEIKSKTTFDISHLDSKILVECCSVVEESLGNFYRLFRSKNGLIGALEIRVVKYGTFDTLMDFFISQGTSLSQYKTPLCITSTEALAILENNVLKRFFSGRFPPFTSLSV